jgi:hypothetical protein
MAKKTKHRRKKSFTIPIAVVAGLAPGLTSAWNALNTGGPQGLSVNLQRNYLGYDPVSRRFWSPLMAGGTYPLMFGLVGHFLASKLGFNRMLASAGVPIIRI